MLAIRLPEALEARLAALAKRTGRSKSYYARKALELYLDQREAFLLSLAKLESSETDADTIEKLHNQITDDI